MNKVDSELNMFPPEEVMRPIREFANGHLAHGRDWDLNHTVLVVDYAKRITTETNRVAPGSVDGWVTLPAAQLHDIGYAGLFKGLDSNNRQAVLNAKEQHMVNGAKWTREYFQKHPEISKNFTPAERMEIIEIVGIHDQLERVAELTRGRRRLNLSVVVEADTLAAIDVGRITPTFDKKGLEKHEGEARKRRFPLFETERGIQSFENLIEVFHRYWTQLPEGS